MTSNKDSVYEQTKAAADGAYEEFERARQAFNENWNSATHNAKDSSEAATKKVEDTYDATKNSASDYFHDIEQARQAMNESARHAVEHARESCAGAAKAASEKAHDAYNGTWETFEHAGEALSNTATAVAEGAREAVQGLADSQPVSYRPTSYPSSIVLQHPWVMDQLE